MNLQFYYAIMQSPHAQIHTQRLHTQDWNQIALADEDDKTFRVSLGNDVYPITDFYLNVHMSKNNLLSFI